MSFVDFAPVQAAFVQRFGRLRDRRIGREDVLDREIGVLQFADAERRCDPHATDFAERREGRRRRRLGRRGQDGDAEQTERGDQNEPA